MAWPYAEQLPSRDSLEYPVHRHIYPAGGSGISPVRPEGYGHWVNCAIAGVQQDPGMLRRNPGNTPWCQGTCAEIHVHWHHEQSNLPYGPLGTRISCWYVT